MFTCLFKISPIDFIQISAFLVKFKDGISIFGQTGRQLSPDVPVRLYAEVPFFFFFLKTADSSYALDHRPQTFVRGER